MKLKFYLLGPPIITYNEQSLTIPRRQVRLILYLLAGQKEPIPLDRFCYLFWEDKPESLCRRNLSHLFTHIRNILPEKEILVLNSLSASFRADLVWSDVVEFKEISSLMDVEENLPSFVKANQLYRGSYLDGKIILNNRELEKNIEQNRAYLERLYLNNLTKLITLNKDLQNFSEAIEFAEDYLQIDPLNERILCDLLICHYQMGNQSKVIQRYDLFREHLKDELDIQPSQRTRELYQQILDSISGNKNYSPNLQTSTDLKMELMDQFSHNHLNCLQQIVDNQGDQFGVVLICGDLGIGKSNLISIFKNQGKSDRAFFRIKCTSATKKIKFYPFKELATQIIGVNHHEKIQTHLIPHRIIQIAEKLIYPIQIDSNTTNKIIDAIHEREFSLIQELFQNLTKISENVTISIEDLEWADEDSLELLLYLSEKFINQKITIICTFCCTKEIRLKVFEAKIQNSQAHFGTIHMDDLSFSATQEIIEKCFGEFPDCDQFARQMRRLTSGNSFYVYEILKWMKINGKTSKDLTELQSIEIPPSIKHGINARLNRLSFEEREILNYASAKGTSFGFDDIRSFHQFETHKIVSALDDLVSRNLLVVDSTNYRIKNEIVRETILLNIGLTQKQFLIRSIGESK